MPDSDKIKITKILERLYPDPSSELVFKNPYQLTVCVMLSAQCTDKKVNQVSPLLFERYSSFEDLSRARTSDVERIIKPINYYKTKSRHIVETARSITTSFKGKLPETMEGLISLPGIGRKTANVILGELGITPSLPVDTHVFRVARRLGLSSADSVEGVEDDLKAAFRPKMWRNLHHWLIFHGRRVCKARAPQCPDCPLAGLCPSAKIML